MQAQMLAPAAVLVAWTLVMLVWTAVTRFPAMRRAGIDLKNAARGGRGQNLEGVIDERANWKSHNYSHLLEQPTLFYAVSLIIALLGASPTAILAAWIYVALRIVHSFWQATVNVVSIRFTLFALSTLALGVLALRGIELTLFANPGVVS
ncbi:MAPEG family protein [Tsuneonella troitsensis]|uniref:MAPEG family protein n=1 Tax=Tsuneonella troitsensis TaxID=292222 RepID=UPI00070B7E57|nr:MAPEG family protein [Tsuneonella troitsensis]